MEYRHVISAGGGGSSTTVSTGAGDVDSTTTRVVFASGTVSMSSGVVDSATQRVNIATDDPILSQRLPGSLGTTGGMKVEIQGIVVDAIHSATTGTSLSSGTSTTTVYTTTASRFLRLNSVISRINGTVSGMTMQLKVGGEYADIAVTPSASGTWMQLVTDGRTFFLDAGETVQVEVTSATASDTMDTVVHGVEEA